MADDVRARDAAGGATRLSVAELNKECRWRGLSTTGCVERGDLERLLAEDDERRSACGLAARTAAAPTPAEAAATSPGTSAAGGSVADVKAELESWVAYAPRALSLLARLERHDIDVAMMKDTKIGVTVKPYVRHSDPAVAAAAGRLIEAWRRRFHEEMQQHRPPKPPPADAKRAPAEPKTRALRGKRASIDDDDSDNDASACSDPREEAADAAAVSVSDGDGDAEDEEGLTPCASSSSRAGWSESKGAISFRGKKEFFKVFTLRRPFGCSKWEIRLRISEAQCAPECLELLDQMAVDFGAVSSTDGGVRPEDEQTLRRLQRLEERFRGSGVTEGEARNAVRLFERELSKANWTEDKFVKLKRQLAGVEEWSAADAVAESSVRWTEEGRRRQAWFCDASERIATPLGLEFGYTNNGGACFAGPLASAAGAALTTLLVCHLADLDLQRSLSSRGRSKIVAAQFLQGFVDGALEVKRHLVWQQLFSIEDDDEAARVCQQNLREGFFGGDEGADAEAGDEGAEGADLHELLRGLFSGRGGSGGSSSQARSSEPQSFGPNPDLPPVYGDPPGYQPFKGRGNRLSEEDESSSGPTKGEPSAASGSGAHPAPDSWAITFASNLQVARSSRRRSRAEAKKVYHWTFSGQAVKATPTGTQSYDQGKSAGQKRKGEIDGATGKAKSKFRKGGRLAIAR